MCVDFRNLNKACPKDAYPIPRIIQPVDSTSEHEMLNFMDAYSSYKNIKMNPFDEVHIVFDVYNNILCYKVMSFKLVNIGVG